MHKKQEDTPNPERSTLNELSTKRNFFNFSWLKKKLSLPPVIFGKNEADTTSVEEMKPSEAIETMRAPKWKAYPLFLIALVATVGGTFMLLDADTSIFQKLIGALGVLFFGGLGGKIIYSTLVKDTAYVEITPKALILRFLGQPVYSIPWADIEGFGRYKIKNQEFTTVRLNKYDNILQNISPEDAKKSIEECQNNEVFRWCGGGCGLLGN